MPVTIGSGVAFGTGPAGSVAAGVVVAPQTRLATPSQMNGSSVAALIQSVTVKSKTVYLFYQKPTSVGFLLTYVFNNNTALPQSQYRR
jgi:hypothetical protein